MAKMPSDELNGLLRELLSNGERLQYEELVYRRLERDQPTYYGSLPDAQETFNLTREQVDGKTYFVPRWFPREIEGSTLSPHQRVTWFHSAVQSLLPSDYDQISNEQEKKLLALLTLPILHTDHANGLLSTPDLL